MGKNMSKRDVTHFDAAGRDATYRDTLYLGSQSQPRQNLLKLAGIKFKVLEHKSSECVVEPSDDFEKYVISIAIDKMQQLDFTHLDVAHLDVMHLDVARVQSSQIKENKIFVLTADTLIKTDKTNQILGKPKDLEDAKQMLRGIREQSVTVLTGCCLQVMKLSVPKPAQHHDAQQQKPEHWLIEKQECWATGAQVEFCVDEQSLDFYFEKEPWALHACGGGVIEGVGQSFLKSINGSYTAVLGLPLFELRQKLNNLKFKF
jgi:septum formation protein